MSKTTAPDLYQDLSPEAREQALRDQADGTDHIPVRREYDDDTKEQLRDFVVAESTIVMEKTKEFKDIAKEFNDALKKHKESVTDALVKIKQGYSENDENVFNIADQESGMMNVYDKFGCLLHSRKLKPAEKQATIHSLTGTNN